MRRFMLAASVLALCAHVPADVVTITSDVTLSGATRIGINLGALEKWGPGHYLKNLVHNPGFESGEYNALVPVAAARTDAFQEAFWNAAWNKPNEGKPAGFWEGGTFEVLSGRNAGHTGTITRFVHEPDFRARVDDPRHTFYVSPPFPKAPGELDIIRVHKTLRAGDYHDANLTEERRWTFSEDARPGSPGVQSMVIHGRPASQTWRPVWDYYMDSYGRDSDRAAGKMIVFRGGYRLAFWAKADRPAKFRARLHRSSGEVFLEKTFDVTTEWREYAHEVTVPEGADPYPSASVQPAVLSFNIDTGDAVVKVDDLYLGVAGGTGDSPGASLGTVPGGVGGTWDSPGASLGTVPGASGTVPNATAFCDELVERVREYRPGVLRFWGSQLGAGLRNQLAEPFARGTHGYQPKAAYGGTYSYSLHEFLELCREIGAEPWYVMPPTFSQEELAGLVEYLGAPAGAGSWAALRAAQGQAAPWTEVFKAIHVEYGNEMWGTGSGDDPFYGASAVGGTRLGQIAQSRFNVIKASPGYSDRIRLIVGGQAGWPPTNKDIMVGAQHADALAIAPYFGALKTWGSAAEIWEPLLASPEHWTGAEGMTGQSVRQARDGKPGVALAIYENNFHTTKTAAPEAVTNGYVAGFGGALALSRHSLHAMQVHGIRTQCPFSLVGFSFPNQLPDHKYQVRLWGMLRDLLATGRKRPTWLGVELANRAIFGDMVRVEVETETRRTVAANDVPATDLPVVQAYAFRDGVRTGVIVYNLDMEGARAITLALPEAADLVSASMLTADALDVTNEDAENVRIEPLAGVQRVEGAAGRFTLTLPQVSMAAMVFAVNDNGPGT